MTDPAASLRAAHDAVENLVNLYFDRVPVEELDRELLAETIHEGLSDEWDRLYRIEAAVVELPADRAAAERVRAYLEARLDQVAVDPADVFNVLTGAVEPPLSPYYSHEACGFHWHGRNGMDIPIKDGQPICPRCELVKAEKKLAAIQRRRDEVGAECKRRGKRVLEQSEQVLALERQLDEVRRQLGAEILRAGQAEAELRRMADEPAAAPPSADQAADGPVDDMRELYAVQHAIRDAGGELTRDVHKAVDALREVWDREVRRLQELRRTSSAPTDRAAVLWAADFAEGVAESLRKHHEFERAKGALDVMTELRRMADETPATKAHACRNCAGIDPDTCLMNPNRARTAAGALPFRHIDDDGDQLDIGTVMASTYDGEAPVVYVAADQHQGDQVATVYVRPEHVEQVVTALRSARQAAETLSTAAALAGVQTAEEQPATGARQDREAATYENITQQMREVTRHLKEDVQPQVQKWRDLLAGQREQAHAEGEHCFCGPDCAAGARQDGARP